MLVVPFRIRFFFPFCFRLKYFQGVVRGIRCHPVSWSGLETIVPTEKREWGSASSWSNMPPGSRTMWNWTLRPGRDDRGTNVHYWGSYYSIKGTMNWIHTLENPFYGNDARSSMVSIYPIESSWEFWLMGWNSLEGKGLVQRTQFCSRFCQRRSYILKRR